MFAGKLGRIGIAWLLLLAAGEAAAEVPQGLRIEQKDGRYTIDHTFEVPCPADTLLAVFFEPAHLVPLGDSPLREAELLARSGDQYVMEYRYSLIGLYRNRFTIHRRLESDSARVSFRMTGFWQQPSLAPTPLVSEGYYEVIEREGRVLGHLHHVLAFEEPLSSLAYRYYRRETVNYHERVNDYLRELMEQAGRLSSR